VTIRNSDLTSAYLNENVELDLRELRAVHRAAVVLVQLVCSVLDKKVTAKNATDEWVEGYRAALRDIRAHGEEWKQ
jgi:phage gp36-like protein